MRKTIYTGLAALILGLMSTACTDQLTPAAIEKENLVPEQKEKTMVFRASLEQPESATKTSLSGTDVVWNEGDQIRIFNEATPAGAIFTLKAGYGGEVDGEFVGTDIGAGPYYAIYPASVSDSFTTSPLAINTVVEANQTYVANSFGNGANVAVASAADMNLSFKNVFGAISFTLTGSATISKINIYTRENEILNGSLHITGINTANPTGTMSAAVVKDVNLYKSLSCGAGVALNAGPGVTFYITVPVGAFANGFYVEFIDNAGTAMIKSVNGTSHVIKRSEIHQMGTLAYGPETDPYRPLYSSAFLQEKDDFAAYASVVANSGIKRCTYTEGQSQYAVNKTASTRYVRFQDWKTGYSLALDFSMLALPLNAKPNVAVTALGATGDGITTKAATAMKIVKRTAKHAWVVDTNSGEGYVILVED